jgi:rifampicin phosphotransferase
MRRAILAAGSLLAESGRLQTAAHLVEANWEELLALLDGRSAPDAGELAARAQHRATAKVNALPPFLGPPPEPPHSTDGLPPAVARMMRAMGAAVDAIFKGRMAPPDQLAVRGIGASPGSYTGTARLIASPEDFGRLQQGDVLVAATTTESFNLVLPLVGAIVTDAGGLLSHAAIVSREFGIPSVVGCRDATQRIADGARVLVDGNAGSVVVVEA